MENFQSGKTQAIDLDELGLLENDQPTRGGRAKGDFELDKWGDDPWAQPTEEERQRRRWAEDQGWSGDDNESRGSSGNSSKWTGEEKGNDGWNAPKRGDVMQTSDGWDDWGSSDGGPLKLDEEDETKENGGRRKLQAATAYGSSDGQESYGGGHAQREDVYQSKEAYGTAGIRERHGDPYANASRGNDAPMPEMKPVDEWDMSSSSSGGSESGSAGSAQAAASNGGEDIPGMSRASLIIFQPNVQPVVYEIKKVSTTIGRGLDNMVILNDEFASRHHLSIKYVNGRYEAFGLSQDNPACCNKYPFTHILLAKDDQIELGATRVKFVLGAISDFDMKLKQPKNGCPIHLNEPPAALRSAKITKKSLLALLGAVGGVLLLAIIGLVVMSSLRSSREAEIQAKIDAEKARIAAEEEAARKAEEDAQVELSDEENNIVDGMYEAYRAIVGDVNKSDAQLAGDKANVKVESMPVGARIYNGDGSFRGVTPYDTLERIDGSREEIWTLRMDGYSDTKVDVKLEKGMAPVIVKLEGGSGAPAAAAPVAAPPAQKPAAPKTTTKPATKTTPNKTKAPAKKQPGKRVLL